MLGRLLPQTSFACDVSLFRRVIRSQVRNNAWRASLGKIARSEYLMKYPVRIMRPNGSTIEIRASEPRECVQLAVDLKALSEDERRQRLAARKPKTKKIQKEVIDDNFDADDYMKLFYTPSEQLAISKSKSSPSNTITSKAASRKK